MELWDDGMVYRIEPIQNSPIDFGDRRPPSGYEEQDWFFTVSPTDKPFSTANQISPWIPCLYGLKIEGVREVFRW